MPAAPISASPGSHTRMNRESLCAITNVRITQHTAVHIAPSTAARRAPSPARNDRRRAADTTMPAAGTATSAIPNQPACSGSARP